MNHQLCNAGALGAPNRSFARLRAGLVVALTAGGPLGCSSDGAGGVGSGVVSPGPNGDGTGTRPLAAPKFEFSPGPPGRAVGVRAIVSVDGKELTSDPVELALVEPSTEKSTATRRSGSSPFDLTRADGASPAGELGVAREGLSMCPAVGADATEMGTVNGHICFYIVSDAVGVIGAQRAFLVTTFFAREGVYMMSQYGSGQSVPPAWVNATATLSYGCIAGDQPGKLTADYFGGLSTLSFSYGLPIPFGWTWQVGTTLWLQPGDGIQRATQADIGMELAASILPFPVGATYMETRTARTLNFVRPWNGECGAAVTEQNAIEYVRDQMESWTDVGDEALSDVLAQQVAQGSLPLFQSLSESGEGGLSDNVPAGSNADYYAQFLSSPSGELDPNAPNTSADSLTLRTRERLDAAGDDGRAILAAGRQSLDDQNQSVPSLSGQATLQREAGVAARAAEELSGLNELETDGVQKFIAQDVKRITTPSGEQARIQIRASEIAALLDRPVADVDGATVIVNAGSAIKDAGFILEGEGLALDVDVDGDGLLVRFDVDLSTAAGDFPPDVKDWIVRPSMYLIEVEAGPAAGVLFSAPGQLASGGAASLSAQVIDENGRRVKRPFSVRFVDGLGNEVGAVDSEGGSALLQYVPEPSTPEIAAAGLTSINSGGSSGPGLEISGTGFSRDARVLVDGTPLVVDTDFQVAGPERILIRFPATLAPGDHSVRVINPEGLASGEVAFNIP